MTSQNDVDYRAYFDSTYLRAWDLPPGRDVTVIIERVEGAEIKGVDKTERRPVVFFRGKQKGMVVNKTMGRTIKGLYGSRVKDWIGQAITIYATTTNAFGETHDVVRIRPTVKRETRSAPNKPAPAALPEPNVHDAEFEDADKQEAS